MDFDHRTLVVCFIYGSPACKIKREKSLLGNEALPARLGTRCVVYSQRHWQRVPLAVQLRLASGNHLLRLAPLGRTCTAHHRGTECVQQLKSAHP
eukprot:1941060-Amphidinium_carterae.1